MSRSVFKRNRERLPVRVDGRRWAFVDFGEDEHGRPYLPITRPDGSEMRIYAIDFDPIGKSVGMEARIDGGALGGLIPLTEHNGELGRWYDNGAHWQTSHNTAEADSGFESVVLGADAPDRDRLYVGESIVLTLATDNPGEDHHIVIGEAFDENHEAKRNTQARDRLARRLCEHARSIHRAVWIPESEAPTDTPGESIRERFAQWLEGTFPGDTTTPAKVRQSSAKLWANHAHLPIGASWPKWLARLIWTHEIGPELERRSRLITPAATILVADGLRGANRAEVEAGARRPVLRGERDGLVGEMEPPQRLRVPKAAEAIAIMAGWQKAAASYAGQLMIRRFFHDAFALAVADAGWEVAIDGGIAALARTLGISSKHEPTLRDALNFYDSTVLTLAGPAGQWRGRLLTVSEWTPAAPGRPQRIRIHFGEPMRPGFFREIEGTGRAAAHARYLVPILPSYLVPPRTVGGPKLAGSMLALQDLLMRHFAERAPEYAEKGSVHVGPKEWAALLDEAHIGSGWSDAIRKAWIAPSDGLLPLLQPSGADRYALTPHAKDASDALKEWGRYRLGKSKVAKQRKRRRGKG